jgi:Protein of unknown function (DUF1203)
VVTGVVSYVKAGKSPNPTDAVGGWLILNLLISLRCYDKAGLMVGGELVGDRLVEEVIVSLFGDPDVAFLHARTATVGCFIAQIDRA